MIKQSAILGGIATLSVVLGTTSGAAIAQMSHEEMQTREQLGEFQRIDQPLWVKGTVTAGGLGLIGLELWWFLLSKPKSRKAATQGGVQEITVTVDGGYEPSQIVVQAGQPVRLNFDRKDPSSCLEEVRLPDFRIAQDLPLNQVTAIEFTSDKPGRYEFTCGMNMFRGVVEVQSREPVAAAPITSVSTLTHHPESSADSTSSVAATLTPAGVQEAKVTVARGYQPKRVIVEAGHPVRLQFDRQNSSSCYDQLLIPDFAIAVDFEPETTTVEFIPEQPGEYEFMCGMKMNRGVIEVHAPQHSNPEKAVA
ncbi:cupredoxin domain-containing protein [Leptolyngbya sp. FACHB-711]|uniref:cupredoxin domain-containing protein n=1 Tax=unclassified Leptolyngbya TaxID=2650499 RepID=UPI0016890A56|nr:cupredoxin domain-containing protein [Leptolyngbya sp. FACHB-711]MBD1848507.1 cupredoxin domain-containing protein [Cyanobacteria bacterium FACHB-502]MBD2025502.1 cupredoxin domain-containing protein [Leptolyngbya sp. FACHB-711]